MKQSTFRASSAPKETFGPNTEEGLRYAKQSDPEMLRQFKAVVKIIRRTPERYDSEGHTLALTTKRIDLELSDEVWTLLELHAERMGAPLVWAIKSSIRRRDLKEAVEQWKRADLERELAAIKTEPAR